MVIDAFIYSLMISPPGKDVSPRRLQNRLDEGREERATFVHPATRLPQARVYPNPQLSNAPAAKSESQQLPSSPALGGSGPRQWSGSASYRARSCESAQGRARDQRSGGSIIWARAGAVIPSLRATPIDNVVSASL